MSHGIRFYSPHWISLQLRVKFCIAKSCSWMASTEAFKTHVFLRPWNNGMHCVSFYILTPLCPHEYWQYMVHTSPVCGFKSVKLVVSCNEWYFSYILQEVRLSDYTTRSQLSYIQYIVQTRTHCQSKLVNIILSLGWQRVIECYLVWFKSKWHIVHSRCQIIFVMFKHGFYLSNSVAFLSSAHYGFM